MRNLRSTLYLLIASGIASLPAPARSETTADARDARIEALEQKLLILERKLEIADEEALKKKPDTPVVTASNKGFSLSSPDQAFVLKLRGYLQSDSRWFLNDEDQDINNGDNADTNAFLLRRARPIIEGTVFKNFDYRFMFDLSRSGDLLEDGYVNFKYFPAAQIQAGKFKPPVGLERLQSGSELAFVERGLPTNLIPNRDFGVQLQGALFDNTVNYAVGVFNGVPDGQRGSLTDSDDNKDFAGRLFLQPFRNEFNPLQGLGIGVAGTYGAQEGNYVHAPSSSSGPDNRLVRFTGLPDYVTGAQSRFFRYRAGSAQPVSTTDGISVQPALLARQTTVADGTRYRIAPQAYWYWNRFGLLAEWVRSSQEVAFNTQSASERRGTIDNEAWQIVGSVVLTGEDASFKSVTPKHPFDPLSGAYGAFELVARYGELDIDDEAFEGTPGSSGDTFSRQQQAADWAHEWTVGLNWYLTRNFKLNLDYTQTRFQWGSGSDRLDSSGQLSGLEDRDTERAILNRASISF